jgi:excisionase family DNA binding protein
MQNNNYQDTHLKSVSNANNILYVSSIDEIVSALKASITDTINSAISSHFERNNTRTLNAKEVCASLHISRQTLRNWVEQGKIPQHKIGSRNFYLESEINDSIKKIKKYNQPLAS